MTYTRRKSPLPTGVTIDVRCVADADRVAFGFIMLPDKTRVGFTSTKETGDLELWVGNWGEPTPANARKAQAAAVTLAATLPWNPKVGWREGE